LNTFEHEESYPTLTADRTLVFVRGRPAAPGRIDYDLYVSRFEAGSFTSPRRHPISTDRWGEGDPWIAPDGSYLIFTRWDEEVGWRETVDLFLSFATDGGWTTPVALDELNTAGPDYGPAVSADGRWLYYRADSRFVRVPLAPVLERHRPGPSASGGEQRDSVLRAPKGR
jgi:dipeptidyl aminopeptidase/acylaminoacyl peptidase